MNDFIADLEAELVSAARRRATRRRLPRPRRLVPAIAFAAVALAAIVAVGTLDRSQTADDRPAPPAGKAVLVTLPPALDAEATAACTPESGWSAYAPGEPRLSVFARPRTPADALPGIGDWLPATFVLKQASRQAGARELWVVPVFGPGCPRSADAVESGVCLAAGARHPLARCFSDTAVDAGKAIAVTGPDVVAGVVPDGITSVDVDGVQASVTDNVFEARIPGVEAGDQVRVRFAGKRRICGPSPQAYAAVPALERPPTGNPSAQLERAMADNGSGGAWRDSARAITTREGLTLWLVADVPCNSPTGGPEQVCLLPEGGALACAEPEQIAQGGLLVRFKRGDRVVVAGIAPQRTRRVEVQVRDLVQRLHIEDRVYGTSVHVLPGDNPEVRLR